MDLLAMSKIQSPRDKGLSSLAQQGNSVSPFFSAIQFHELLHFDRSLPFWGPCYAGVECFIRSWLGFPLPTLALYKIRIAHAGSLRLTTKAVLGPAFSLVSWGDLTEESCETVETDPQHWGFIHQRFICSVHSCLSLPELTIPDSISSSLWHKY